jgi:hypothetical protein
VSGLPDFSWFNLPTREKYSKLPQNIPNGHKIYQIAENYTEWLKTIPNGCKIDQMSIICIYLRLPLRGPLKFTQIAILGLKISVIWQTWTVCRLPREKRELLNEKMLFGFRVTRWDCEKEVLPNHRHPNLDGSCGQF